MDLIYSIGWLVVSLLVTGLMLQYAGRLADWVVYAWEWNRGALIAVILALLAGIAAAFIYL